MRRLLSILFSLALLVTQAGAAIPAGALTSGAFDGWTGKADESRLPACCRRNGVHHCAMHAGMDASPGENSVVAASCCPCYPTALAGSATTFAALTLSRHQAAGSGSYRPFTGHSLPIALSEQNTRPQRGPPYSKSL